MKNCIVCVLLLVCMFPSVVHAKFAFTMHMIEEEFGQVFDAVAHDLDEDGDMDVVSCSINLDEIGWWENDGSQNWTFHSVDNVANGATNVKVIDLDQDGDLDIVGAIWNASDICWYENDGSENFTKRYIATSFGAANWVEVLDINKDGTIDVVSAAYARDEVAYWANDGNQNWTKIVIGTDMDMAWAVKAADLDKDGHMDFVAVANLGDVVKAYYNDGTNLVFTEKIIESDFDGAKGLYLVDLNKDGRIDVVAGASVGDEIAWWQNNGDRTFGSKQHIASVNNAHFVNGADMDQDGDVDLVSIAKNSSDIFWLENDGNLAFTKHDIHTNFTNPTSASAYDIDGDGDLDVLGTAMGANDIRWWENIGPPTATVSLSDVTHTYDGNGKEAAVTTTPAGLTLDITYDGAALPPVDAGTYTIVATVNDGSYVGTVSGTLIINKAEASVVLGDLSQNYDGSQKPVNVSTNPSGLAVDVSYNGSSIVPSSAGSYTVIGTIDHANYQSMASGTLTINKAEASVILGDLSQNYDGSQKSVTTSTDPPGLMVDVRYNGLSSAPVNTGSYAVVALIDAPNYQGIGSGVLTISPSLPSVQTTPASSVAPTNFISGGNVIFDGGSLISERGVCWNENGAPTNLDFCTNNGSGTGVFESIISSLSPGTLYYFRAYATNNIGTGYGVEYSVSTTALFTLHITKTGGKLGTITSTPPGIDCGALCEKSYSDSTSVDLNVTPIAGVTFLGWSGDSDCEDGHVVMTTDMHCTANFYRFPWILFEAATRSGIGK